MTNLFKKTEMEISSVNGTEVPLKPNMPAGLSCSDLNTASYLLTTDDSTSVIAEVSPDTKTKTLNVMVTNCNAVLVRQVEHIKPLESEADSSVKCFSRSGVSDWEKESQQKSNTSSGEVFVDVEQSLPVIRKEGLLNGPQCEKMLQTLELLQDSGAFEDHKRKFHFYLQRCNKDMEVITNTQQIPNEQHCNQVPKTCQAFHGQLKKDEQLTSLFSRLCTKKEYADMELALVIEQGVSHMYRKQLRKSKVYFTSVIQLAKHCQLRNPNILTARAYILLAANLNSRARKIKNVSAILECLARSEYFLQNHDSPEDWAEMYFTKGLFLLGNMSRIPQDERRAKARKETQENARNCYERAIAICKKDPRLRVQLKRITYCHLGLAALLLDCSAPVARTRLTVIPSQDLKEATKHLDIIEHELGDIPPGTRVQIMKKRSDQYYRQGSKMYQLAKETAQDALQMARSHGFNTELESLQQRIDFLDQLCEHTVYRDRMKVLAGDTSTSDSDFRFEASGSETDENPDENG